MNTPASKPVGKLKPADLAAFPIWEWVVDSEAAGEQDETWVRPTSHQAVPAAAFSQFLVSATAFLNDGSAIPACVEVTVDGSRTTCRPSFVYLLDRQLPFAGAETTRLFSRFSKKANNYPRRWQLNVLVGDERSARTGRARSRGFALALLMWDLVSARAIRKSNKP